MDSNKRPLESRQAIQTALPPLLFGLGIAIAALIRGGPWYAAPPWRLWLSVCVVLVPALTIVAVGLIAISKRFPDWGFTWVGGATAASVLFLTVLEEELIEEPGRVLPPAVEAIGEILVLLVILAVLIAAALKGWSQASLLSIGMTSIAGLSLCQAVVAGPFNRNELALLAAPVGLIFSALVYLFTRASGRGFRLVALAGVWLLNVGLVWMVTGVWHEWLVARGRPNPFWPLMLILTALLLAGPTLGLAATPLRLRLRSAAGNLPE